MIRSVLFLILLFGFSGVWGCSRYDDLPAGTRLDMSGSAVVEREDIQAGLLTTTILEQEYLVGPGDVLSVNVAGKEELGTAASRVDGGGYIRLPILGSVKVDGSSLRQLQDVLAERYSSLLRSPWVVVEIVEYRSHPLYLVGQFSSPGVRYLDRPHNLLQGLALGGGATENADLRGARLIRNGRTQPIDIYRLLQQGDAQQNVALQAGDAIFIPNLQDARIFVFGAVSSPGAFFYSAGGLTLTQALAQAGLKFPGAKDSRVRILRSLSPTQGQLLVVDLAKEMRGEALPFQIQPGDIIYVPTSNLRSWNETLGELLPSLQGVSTLLQPFVQIRYLTN